MIQGQIQQLIKNKNKKKRVEIPEKDICKYRQRAKVILWGKRSLLKQFWKNCTDIQKTVSKPCSLI